MVNITTVMTYFGAAMLGVATMLSFKDTLDSGIAGAILGMVGWYVLKNILTKDE